MLSAVEQCHDAVPPSVSGVSRRIEQGTRRRVHDRAVVRDHDAGLDLVGQVDRQRAVVHQVGEQRADVAAVRGGRGGRRIGGEVAGADDRHAARGHDRLVRPGAGDVAAEVARAEVDDDRAGRHRRHRGLGDEQRRAAAGHLRGGDDDVVLGDVAGQLVLLGLLLLGRERAGVAALAGRAGHGGELEELRAERLDLGRGGRSHVVRADDRAEPAGGRDGLEPGDAGPEHQDLGRACGAGRRHQQREVAVVDVRRGEHGPVAGHAGLRAQHVHRLRAADRAGQAVEADRGDAGRGQLGGVTRGRSAAAAGR